MKAVICTKYGDPQVLKIDEVAKPEPKKNEIRIKIETTTVTSSDCIIRSFNIPYWHPMGFMMGMMMGFGKPRNPILGMVAVGKVDSLGPQAGKFKVGEEILAYTVLSPSKTRFGTYAEYICLPEDWMIFKKPDTLSNEEAAAIPYPAELAMHFLEKGDFRKRKKILIVGASGSIGTTAVQIATHHGAQVTGVCSTKNMDLVKSLGADRVIDYTQEDYSKGDTRYDLIIDSVPQQTANRKQLKRDGQRVLNPGGKFVSIDEGLAVVKREYLEEVIDLAAQGKFKPVIDSVYPLDKIVEAHEKVEGGHKRGSVIISV